MHVCVSCARVYMRVRMTPAYSQGSKKYGPTGLGSFYGKGEGAKETLGMISI